MDRFAHTDAAYLIADSILGELTFVRQALEAAGCERISYGQKTHAASHV